MINPPDFKPKEVVNLGGRYSFVVYEVHYVTDHSWKYVGWILKDGIKFKYGTVSEIVLLTSKLRY